MSSTFQFNEFQKLRREMMKKFGGPVAACQGQRMYWRHAEFSKIMPNQGSDVQSLTFQGGGTRFSCTLTHVGFVVDKAALTHVIFDLFGFPPLLIIIPPMLRTH